MLKFVLKRLFWTIPSLIWDRLWITLSQVFTWIIAIPVCVYSAARRSGERLGAETSS